MSSPCASNAQSIPPQSIVTYPDPQLPGSLEEDSIFWQTPRDPFLKGHRTTAELPESADIVIIGSGIAGAQLARYLYEKKDGAWLHGKSVVMLEAREGCSGATGRNGGHCKPNLYSYPVLSRNDPSESSLTADTIQHIRFELSNYKWLTSYIEEASIQCDYKRVPACNAYFEQLHFDKAVRAIQKLQQDAPDIAQRLKIVTDRNELRDELRIPSAVGAVTFEAAQLSPYKFVCHVLRNLIKKHGLNLQTGTPVLGWTTLNGASQTPLHRIRTERGSVTAPIVVHATNAHASHLIPRFRDLIYPVRGQMSALQPPTSLFEKPLTHSYGLVEDCEIKSSYLIQAPQYIENGVVKGGELLLGGGRGFAKNHGIGVTDDSHVDQAVATELRHTIKRLFQGESGFAEDGETKAKFEWTGTMAFSADGQPWVGRVLSDRGHFILAGFSGHGMSLTTASAKGLAHVIHHHYPDILDYSKNWRRTIVQALYSYNEIVDPASISSNDQINYLNFEAEDYIDVQEKAGNGWWYGHVIDDLDRVLRSGWFPRNYVNSSSCICIPPIVRYNISVEASNPRHRIIWRDARIRSYHGFSWFSKLVWIDRKRLSHVSKCKEPRGSHEDTDTVCHWKRMYRLSKLTTRIEHGGEKTSHPDTNPSSQINILQLQKAQTILSQLQSVYQKTNASPDSVIQEPSDLNPQSMNLAVDAVNEFLSKLAVIPNLTTVLSTNSKLESVDITSQEDQGEEDQEWVFI